MFGKSVVLVLSAVGLSLVAAVLSDPIHPAKATSRVVPLDTLIVTVEMDSLKVLSIVDDAGNQHPVDSTLVPPVPVRGPRRAQVVFTAPVPSELPLAGMR